MLVAQLIKNQYFKIKRQGVGEKATNEKFGERKDERITSNQSDFIP